MIPALAILVVTSTAPLSREGRLGVDLIHAQQERDDCLIERDGLQAKLEARPPAALETIAASEASAPEPAPSAAWLWPTLGGAGLGSLLVVLVLGFSGHLR